MAGITQTSCPADRAPSLPAVKRRELSTRFVIPVFPAPSAAACRFTRWLDRRPSSIPYYRIRPRKCQGLLLTDDPTVRGNTLKTRATALIEGLANLQFRVSSFDFQVPSFALPCGDNQTTPVA